MRDRKSRHSSSDRVAITVAAAILLSFGSSSGAMATSQAVVELNNAGVKLLTKNQFEKAIDRLEAAVKLDPDYDPARSNLAIAYNNWGLEYRTEDPRLALSLFHRAFLMDPSNKTTVLNMKGIVKLMKKEPESFADRVELADRAWKMEDYRGAAVEYLFALKQTSNDPRCRERCLEASKKLTTWERAVIKSQLGLLKSESSSSVASAVPASKKKAKTPSLSDEMKAMIEKEVERRLKGSSSGAVKKEFSTTSKLSSSTETLERVDELMRDAKYYDAIKILSRMIRKDGGNSKAYLRRASAFYKTEQDELAFPDAKKAIELDPEEVRGYDIASDIARALGKYQEAVDYLTKAIDIDPSVKAFYSSRSYCYKKLEEKEKSTTDKLTAKSKTGKLTYAWEYRGTVNFGPYMADLQKRIKRAWFPDKDNRSKRVMTVFKVHHNGKMSRLRLARSSGDAGADRAALKAVQNAAPFRPLPAGSPRDVDIQFTFDYNVFKSGRKIGGGHGLTIPKRSASGSKKSIEKLIEAEVEKRLKERMSKAGDD